MTFEDHEVSKKKKNKIIMTTSEFEVAIFPQEGLTYTCHTRSGRGSNKLGHET